jgi:DNA processing protein
MAGGIGPASFFALIRRFGSPTEVFAAAASELRRRGELQSRARADLAQADRLRERAEVELRALEKIGGSVLIYGQSGYPEFLRHTSQPPPVLYVLGKPEALQMTSIAIVGSRAATSYGRRVAHTLGRDLASAQICVVSGLALGIDGAAHGGALAAHGATAAVLGCGLDVVYPKTNRRFYEQIRNKGLLVSEYPLGTPPEPFRFPARNRIIAGLSRGIVVVEASRKSGSLITVQFGLEEGREIFAIPGQVDSAKSAGAHWLVQQGATLVVSVDDILEHLSLRPAAPAAVESAAEIGRPRLGRDTAALLAMIEPYPQQRNELLQMSKFSPAKLQELLLLLELEGLIELLPGDRLRKLPV